MGSSTYSHFPLHLRYGLFVLIVLCIWGPLQYTARFSTPPLAAIDDIVAYPAQQPNAHDRQTAIPSSLPLEFQHQFPTHKNVVIEFSVQANNPAPSENYAVYIPWLNGNANLYLNGQRITPLTSGEYTTVQSGYPLLIDFHTSQLKPENNLISVVIESEFLGEGMLDSIYFDSLSTLQPYWNILYFHKVTVVHLLSAALFLLLVMAAFTHIFIQKDDLYLWFIVVGIAWILSSEIYLVVNFPAPDVVRRMLFSAANLVTISVLPVFARRYMNIGHSLSERRYLTFAALELLIVCCLILLNPTEQSDLKEAYIRIRALSCIVYIVFRYRAHLKQQAGPASLLSLWLTSLALASMTFPLHSVISFFTGYSLVPAKFFLTGSIHLIMVFATIYLSRVYQSFHSLKTLNQELDQRVSDATQEVQRRFAQVQNMRQTQAVTKERQRIMQDIHDGVAGHLVSAIAIAKRRPQTDTRIVELLQTSITDLRLVVDSLVPEGHDINQLLTNFHSRIQPILTSAGIDLDWQLALPECRALTPEQLLSLYRCLQEAFTNIIRHADATHIEVTGVDSSDSFAVIRIDDNGHGLVDQITPGNGLTNIKDRMQALGGYAEIKQRSAHQSGLNISLWIPKHADC